VSRPSLLWTTEGESEDDISQTLELAATAAQEWVEANAVTFDTEKTEAILLSRRRKRKSPTQGIQVAGRTIQFNKQATRWLRVWLDSQLTLKEHHEVRLKKARNAQNRLRRLAGQVGLSSENCRRVQTACVQAAALFGAELWWKGDNVHGMGGRRDAVQRLVNQEAQLTTGAFRTTNQGALSLESGIKPAATQLDNRLRRFALRLASLPRGDQARRLVEASGSSIEQRLQSALGCWNGREETVLLEVASPLEASTTIEEEAAAAREANRLNRPGLTNFTDGSRPENGATGYAVTWKKGNSWKGHKTHMGWGQEAFDAECAALARALQVAATRKHTIGSVTVFTDAQAAIWRLSSDEPGPGQKYALEARTHIASFRWKEPNVRIDIRWCPSHQGIEGNEVAD